MSFSRIESRETFEIGSFAKISSRKNKVSKPYRKVVYESFQIKYKNVFEVELFK